MTLWYWVQFRLEYGQFQGSRQSVAVSRLDQPGRAIEWSVPGDPFQNIILDIVV